MHQRAARLLPAFRQHVLPHRRRGHRHETVWFHGLPEAVKGRAKWASDGRVKVCHLRQRVCDRVGSVIPGAGITEELARGEPTQDGNRNFNTDTV